jgi:arylsulfatase A-like enzyme
MPAEVQGNSLKEIMRGDAPPDWRDSIYYHYYEYPGFHNVKAHYGVRTHRYKLIHFYDDIDEWEFFDLEVDPHELHNLIDDPDTQNEIAALRAEIHKLREKYQDPDDGRG